MANLKPMIDHIARGLVSPADWDQLSGPTKAVALAKATHLLADAPILYDALRDDKLRELVTYCENEAVDPHILSGGLAYNDIAAQLRKILDGQ